MTDRLRSRERALPEGFQFGDGRVDGRADRPSLSGGDLEPDDFDMGGGVPSWKVENGRLVRLPPLPNFHAKYHEYRRWDAEQGSVAEWPGLDWNVIEGEHFAEPACVCDRLFADPSQIPAGKAVTCPEHPGRTIRRGPAGCEN